MLSSSIVSRYLPPPEILRLPSVGIDISDTSLKYVAFKPSPLGKKGLRLTHWGDIPIPAGVISGGDIQDVPTLAKCVAEVRQKTGIAYAHLSLPDEHVYLFETDIGADAKQKEIRSLLEFKLEENVPLSAQESYFDYQIFESDEEEETLSVAVTVSARSIIDGYLETCRLAGVTPLSFEAEPAAMARSVLLQGDMDTKLLVDFGHLRTGIGIVHKGVLLYTSTIDIGGNELSASLRKSLGDRPEKELTEIKNTQGLVQDSNNTVPSEAMIATVSAIKDELGVRVDYWNGRSASGPDRFIEQIVLSGGSANLRGLCPYLTQTLGIETVLANVWQNAFDLENFIPPIDRRHSYGYATAIGLGLAPFSNRL